MLRAVARARELGSPVRLAMVGDGLMRPQLEDLARKLTCEDVVTFLGYRRDLVHIAAGSDAALLTSDNEGTPVALIEAGAAGRPAVATRVGGVTDIVVDGTGLLAPAGDESALATQIGRMCADPDLRQRMGARAREHVSARFTRTRLLSDIDALYARLLPAATAAE
jgi:glycosyltransferase involved in cell wall biosynthesis